MEIGVYGGSFNPPHVGHGMVAAWLYWSRVADEVWLVPTLDHPFGKPLVAFDRRVQWCELLAQCVGDWVSVCTIERELPTPSYMIHTLDALAKRYPMHRFRLVIGSDVLDETSRWKDWDRIKDLYSPIVLGRSGFASVPGAVSFPDISSSDIRTRIANGDSVSHLVPASVLAELGDLYRE